MTQPDDFNPMGVVNPPADVEALRSLAAQMYNRVGPLRYSEPSPVAVEVGTWAGATARMLADMDYRVFCIDHWLGNPNDDLGPIAEGVGQVRAFETFCRNMGPRLYRSVFPLIGTSKQHAAVWPRDLKIDFLFIDDGHEEEDVLADIGDRKTHGWARHLRPGGIECGHDYHPLIFPGVVAAVQQTGPFIVCENSTIWYRTAHSP